VKRQPDGTFRGARRPVVVSAATVRARWVESEVLALKCMGLRLEEIARHIARVGRGQEKPITPLPEHIAFEPNYSISRQACHKAFNKALAREPSFNAKEFRKLCNLRCETMYLNLQPSMRQSDPQAAVAGVRILEFQAKLNNCLSADRARKLSVQEEDGDGETKSRAEIEAEGAKYLDLFYGGVKILVDLGVPLPQIESRAIETTARLVEESGAEQDLAKVER
jgi:hypothetical protein